MSVELTDKEKLDLLILWVTLSGALSAVLRDNSDIMQLQRKMDVLLEKVHGYTGE